MMIVSDSFRTYLEEAIGSVNVLVAFSAFDKPAAVSVRANPFKNGHGMTGRPVAWNRYGCLLDERPNFTLDPSFHGGAYYVQDSSSMFVGKVFRDMLAHVEVPSSRVIRVLDLCAAPGGKSTDLAASLREAFGDRFLLVSNEVMKQRAGVLAGNMALWGDPNVVVTSDDPRAFAALPGFFDIVVADVPCSGEGMFRKDEEALRQWSEDNVSLCASRQKRIIADMWPCLRKDGVLIYSTCTFNRFENDLNVDWISAELGAEVRTPFNDVPCPEGVVATAAGYSLVPGLVEGEGQYCAALVKTGEDAVSFYADAPKGRGGKAVRTPVQIPDNLNRLFRTDVRFRCKGETITAVPEVIAGDVSYVESQLHVIAAGTAVGVIKGKDLVPDADLALSVMFNDNVYPSVEVDRQTALAFLHKDTVAFPQADRGYLVVRYNGLALGFVKNLGNRCNNLHPQARRIRMDIRL